MSSGAPAHRKWQAHAPVRAPGRDRPSRWSTEPVALTREGLDVLVGILTRAADQQTPPFERARLLAVFSRHLEGDLVSDAAGPSSRRLVHELLHVLCAERDRILHDDLLPALAADGVVLLRWDEASRAERRQLRTLFHEVIYPLVTPLAVDATRPFPNIPARSLHVAALVRRCNTTQERFACVRIPDQLFGLDPFSSGFVRLDAERLVSIDVIVGALLDDLFPGVQVLERSTFRLVRAESTRAGAGNAWSRLPRLEIADTTTAGLLDILRRDLAVADEAVYRMRPPLGLAERIAAVRDDHRLAGPRLRGIDGSGRTRSERGRS